MRFQQLKSDPNSVTKKRMIKSKKNWVVLTSLSFAGGFFLFSAPELTVNADSIVKTSTTQAVANPSSDKSPLPPTTSPKPVTPHVSTANTATLVSTPDVAQIATVKTDIPTPKTPVEKPIAQDSPVQPAASGSEQPVKPDVTHSVEPKNNVPIDTTVLVPDAQTEISAPKTPLEKPVSQDSTTTPTPSSVNKDSPSVADSKQKNSDLVVAPTVGDGTVPVTDNMKEVKDADLVTELLNTPSNIASGKSNTSHWYISKDKTLHFIDGELEDNEHNTVSPWREHSDDITTASFDGKVTASVHMNNMFSGLPRLEHVKNIENVDFSKTQDMSGMLSNDNNLKEIDLTKNDFTPVKTLKGLLENDAKLTTVNMKNSSFRNVVDYRNLFKNDSSLHTTDISSWQMSSAMKLSGLFQNDIALKNIDIHTWTMNSNADTGDSTKQEGMFDGTNFSSITLSSYNRFSENTQLPSNVSDTWQEVGSGSIDKPAGNKTFTSLTLSSTYPQTSSHNNDYIITTFAPKPGAVKKDLQVHTTVGNSTAIVDIPVFNVTGNVGNLVTVNTPVKDGYTPSSYTVTAQVIDKDHIVMVGDPIHYTGNEIKNAVVTIPITIGSQSQTVTGINGHVGDTISIEVPQKTGYDTDNKNIDAVINADGTVTPKGEIHYNPKLSNSTSLIVASNTGDITVSGITGHHVGDQFKVTVPGRPGYNNGQSSIIDAAVDINGNIVMAKPDQKIQYTGDPVSNLTLTVPVIVNGQKVDDKIFTYTQGHVGDKYDYKDKVDFTIKNRDNYDIKQPSISVTVTPEKKLILVNPTDQIIYTGKPEKGSVTVETNLSHPIEIPVNGHFGETVDVPVPSKTGYDTNSSTIQATVGANNSFTTKDKIIYQPQDAKPQDVTISSDKGDYIIKQVSGHKIGDNFLIDTPIKPGYSPNIEQVHASVDEKGKINVLETVNYSPKTIKGSISITTNVGDKKIDNISGQVDSSKTIDAPPITGYLPDKKTITVSFGTDEKLHPDITAIHYTGRPVKAQDITVKSNKGPQTIHIDNTHRVGDKFTAVVPEQTGYTPVKDKINLIVTPERKITTVDKITYQGNPVSTNVKINSNYPEQIYTDATGNVGDIITVDVPQKDGYTTDKQKIKATVNPDSTITPNESVQYTGNKIDGNVSVKVTLNGKPAANQTIVANQVQVGQSIQLTPAPIHGYHLKKQGTLVNATVNPDSITSSDTIEYIGDPVDKIITVQTNLGSKELHVVGNFGESVSVDVPNQSGYHAANPTIKVALTPDNISPEGTIQYLGDPVKDLTLKIPTYKNGQQIADTTFPIASATVGQKVSIPLKQIPGYTSNRDTVTGIVNEKHKIISTDQIHYTGKTFNNRQLIVHLTLNGKDSGTETIAIDKAQVGQVLHPTPNQVLGYHLAPNSPKLSATVDDQGGIQTDAQINYIGNPVNSAIDVASNLGPQRIKVDGKVGDNLEVPISNPEGYIADESNISVTIGADEKPVTSDIIHFTGKKFENVSLKIPSNKGDQLITNLSGQVGQTSNVTVPEIPGYTADKKTIAVLMNPDGTLSTKEKITYTKVVQPSSTTPVLEKTVQSTHVNTFVDQPKVTVYEQNGADDMKLIPDELINPGTSFISDEKIQINGDTYYRIGINKYIKNNQAYPYTPIESRIQIIGTTTQPLYTAKGSKIKLRTVTSGSIWTIDQIIILNGIKYYRIGTNSFVKASDAVLY